ncbi:MAG: DUF3369 domain-containing protein, partial [Rhodospirillaceae bacterium]|nr:DUF3369 domain-containing protein [Rhodospirillaceae bacterium]
MSEDDFFLDDDAVAEPAAADAQAPWTILVVDDEPDVHDVTRVALAGVRFRGRPMRFLSCLSAAEARQTLASEPDVALILLDVVMESDTAGLDLVHWIREERGDRFVRIVLRTGQPGIAPERRVIEDYDINDYKAKSELTRDRLFTALIGSLRNYQDLQTIEAHRRVIEANRHGLLKIIDAADTIFRVQSAQAFADGVLEQLRALVCPERDVVYAHTTGFAAFSPLADLEIMAGLGSYREAIGRPLHGALEGRLVASIQNALQERRSVSGDDHFVGYVDSGDGRQNVLVLDGVSGPLSEDDQHLVDLYCRNVGVAFDNLMLRDEIERTQREIIYQLGEVVETRSKETGNHVRRVAEYSRVLALAMGCTAEEAEIVRLASPLHDIGKIGIPDAVLLKPGRFDPAER